MACDALEMLVFNEEYESEINAASANMTNLILKGASSDLILSLLTKSGATVQEEPNVLQAFVKQSRQSKKDSQILMRLVEKKADVSEYICEPCENWQHSFLHLCIKLGRCHPSVMSSPQAGNFVINIKKLCQKGTSNQIQSSFPQDKLAVHVFRKLTLIHCISFLSKTFFLRHFRLELSSFTSYGTMLYM